jgi:hypothetical protein
MRETVFTPLLIARRMAAKAGVYPMDVENVTMKVSGTKFPEACRRAASDLVCL